MRKIANKLASPCPYRRTLHLYTKERKKEFEVIGRKLPTEKETTTPLYKLKIFVPDIVTKSRFWYFLRQLKKFKKFAGEIVSLKQIPEKSPVKMKYFDIWLRYDSRSGIHNMYREYRDLSVSGAMTQCYRDMRARHRARAHSIQIIKVEVVKAANCKRPQVKQFHFSMLESHAPIFFEYFGLNDLYIESLDNFFPTVKQSMESKAEKRGNKFYVARQPQIIQITLVLLLKIFACG
ncbi:60S ribosomal protein L18A [Melipona bicolor]|uniref:Large ribosomal subunit protein eL20 n=1 Tax=Melipona bicolor TaxID=60889 RepID=A0AA40KHB5_9HYME|nr:60S ribosomal protein L18A [Melipona bicolor]